MHGDDATREEGKKAHCHEADSEEQGEGEDSYSLSSEDEQLLDIIDQLPVNAEGEECSDKKKKNEGLKKGFLLDKSIPDSTEEKIQHSVKPATQNENIAFSGIVQENERSVVNIPGCRPDEAHAVVKPCLKSRPLSKFKTRMQQDGMNLCYKS